MPSCKTENCAVYDVPVFQKIFVLIKVASHRWTLHLLGRLHWFSDARILYCHLPDIILTRCNFLQSCSCKRLFKQIRFHIGQNINLITEIMCETFRLGITPTQLFTTRVCKHNNVQCILKGTLCQFSRSSSRHVTSWYFSAYVLCILFRWIVEI